MHGVTRQIRVPLRMLGKGPGPYGDQRTGFLCQFELKRSDYDMTNLLEKNLVGDAVSITISLEGTLQEASRHAPPALTVFHHRGHREHRGDAKCKMFNANERSKPDIRSALNILH